MPAPSKLVTDVSLASMTNRSAALLSFAALVSLGCGYTDADMQMLRDRVELYRGLLDKCEAAARSCNHLQGASPRARQLANCKGWGAHESAGAFSVSRDAVIVQSRPAVLSNGSAHVTDVTGVTGGVQ